MTPRPWHHDPEALMKRIGDAVNKREKLREEIARLERSYDYQTKRLRRLGNMRTIALNLTLPLEFGQQAKNA